MSRLSGSTQRKRKNRAVRDEQINQTARYETFTAWTECHSETLCHTSQRLRTGERTASFLDTVARKQSLGQPQTTLVLFPCLLTGDGASGASLSGETKGVPSVARATWGRRPRQDSVARRARPPSRRRAWHGPGAMSPTARARWADAMAYRRQIGTPLPVGGLLGRGSAGDNTPPRSRARRASSTRKRDR